MAEWRERLLLLCVIVGVVWLNGGKRVAPVVVKQSKPVAQVEDSVIIGLYDEHDSLIYSGTPAQMEAYLRAEVDSALGGEERRLLP